MQLRKHKKGFTLIELIVVIVILSIIAAVGAVFLQQGLNAYLTNQYITDLTQQASFALESMSRQLRAVAGANSITTATSSQLVFTDINNNSINYQIVGSNLTLNGNTVMTGLVNASSSFSYLDQNETTTTTIANIRYIVITLIVSQNNVSFTMRTTIFSRNIA